MARLSHLLLASAALLTPLVSAKSAVLDLIPSNFDSVVLKSGKPGLVEFFAPWCGHCRNLAPVYDELADVFAFASDKVHISKVDADENKALGKRFGVQGFPTLKWFDGKSEKPEEYNGGRDLESLTKFVSEKTGINPKGAKGAKESNVKMLTDASFKSIIGGEADVLVAFTAPWCGHCKTLAPTWERLADDFALEPNVIVAKVDAEAENSKATAQAQGVRSYPTIKFFPRGSTEPIAYDGGRAQKDLVEYLNTKAGTHRVIGGGLDSEAGTVSALDALVAKYVVSGEALAGVLEEVKSAAKGLEEKYAAYYVKVLEKVEANKGYVEKELARLERVLGKGGLAPEKVDDLVSRGNILKKFAGEKKGEEGKGKDEL